MINTDIYCSLAVETVETHCVCVYIKKHRANLYLPREEAQSLLNQEAKRALYTTPVSTPPEVKAVTSTQRPPDVPCQVLTLVTHFYFEAG